MPIEKLAPQPIVYATQWRICNMKGGLNEDSGFSDLFFALSAPSFQCAIGKAKQDMDGRMANGTDASLKYRFS
jgi:hypothetical protein